MWSRLCKRNWCHSKSLFIAHWNLFWSKSSMEFSPEFHGTFWTTFEHHPWFHGIPWNLSSKASSSMEFHENLSRSKVPWNSTELFPCSRVPWNSMKLLIFPKKVPWTFFKFHGIPWSLINLIFKKIISPNIVVGIWLMIRCYLAKISQKRYILHWFQYRNSYFEHPSGVLFSVIDHPFCKLSENTSKSYSGILSSLIDMICWQLICYYLNQFGSINLTHCHHIFPWLCAWDVCYIIFCHLLHIQSGKPGILLSLLLCSLWWM